MRTCAVLIVLAATGVAPAQTLYDGATGVRLDQAPWAWQYIAIDVIDGIVETTNTASGGATNLNSMNAADRDDRAGFFLNLPGQLDATTGYVLKFKAQVADEAHDSNDRAGFSVIAISDNALPPDALGVELAFWTDRVFAQSVAFTHAEQALIDTTVMHDYQLRVLGGSYALWADGSPILSGALRNYVGGFGLPYDLPNQLFLGDNTTSAGAQTSIFNVALVPEPASAALLALAAPLLARRRRA